jgi:exodeoxyribonuclease V alpha subunit
MDELRGSVERITYYNPENGYSVLRLNPEQRTNTQLGNRTSLVTVVGNLPEISPGEYLQLRGKWATHPKHGRQFQVKICEQALPATLAGIRRYLGSGLIKGIGPKLAERIVEQFNGSTLEVIENQPERLFEVPDIGPKRAKMIAVAWEEQKQVKDIMLFLHSHGVTTNLAIKIYKQYGQDALIVVQNDPYTMARDIYGVGFKTADRIAQALGLPFDHPSRIEAGVHYALNECTNDGHVFSPYQDLIDRAVSLLDVDPDLVPAAIDRLATEGYIKVETIPVSEAAADQQTLDPSKQVAVYLASLYYSEVGLAARFSALMHALPSRLADIPPAFIKLNPQLTAEQQTALRTAISSPVSVITGGPGTGKTTCLQALIDLAEEANKSYALASPTGRAAKRLSEATGRPAMTIHRLLGYSPREGFKHNAEHPLKVDLVVVDEASMLDLLIAHHLLKAIQPGTHLLLVGDIDQLPSVGAGDVLRDLIASQLAPVSRLSLIFRQAAGSHIITNSHRINQGQLPKFAKDSRDFFLFPVEEPEQAAQWVEDVVCARIPEKFGLNPRDQIQVLAPMYRGPAGINILNQRLQNAINQQKEGKKEKHLAGQSFRVGDKVMQIQNNYEKDVFNGDIGFIQDIDLINHTLVVNYDNHNATYDWSEADQLVLAYAVSVHKSQGSEFPAVVLPILTSHYIMLQRNLLYTAITRAKELCVLVGSRRALAIAVNNDKVAHRHTALDWRLLQLN